MREDGVDRGHVDDRARLAAGFQLLDHLARDRLADEERALEVDRQHAVEVGFGDLEKITAGDDPGVVDQNVDGAIGVERRRDQVAHVELLRHVAVHEHGLAAVLGDVAGGALAGGLLDVRDHDLRPIGREAFAHASPMPFAAPVTIATFPVSEAMVSVPRVVPGPRPYARPPRDISGEAKRSRYRKERGDHPDGPVQHHCLARRQV
jgi:hypothetical protein